MKSTPFVRAPAGEEMQLRAERLHRRVAEVIDAINLVDRVCVQEQIDRDEAIRRLFAVAAKIEERKR